MKFKSTLKPINTKFYCRFCIQSRELLLIELFKPAQVAIDVPEIKF